MPSEISRPARLAMLPEIFGRGAQQPTQIGNFSGNQARFANRRRMHRDIESAFDKIIAPKRKVIEHETDMKMRIGRRETRDRVPQRQCSKRFGGKNF